MNEQERTRGFVFRCGSAEDLETIKKDIEEGKYLVKGIEETYQFFTENYESDSELPESLDEISGMADTSFCEAVVLPAGTSIEKDVNNLFKLKRYKDNGYLIWSINGEPSTDVMLFDMTIWDGEDLNYLDKFTPNMPETDGVEYTNCTGAAVFRIPDLGRDVETEVEYAGSPQGEVSDTELSDSEQYVDNDIEWSGPVVIKDGKRSVHADLVPGGEISYYGLKPGLADRWHVKDDVIVLKSSGDVLSRLERIDDTKWEGRNDANKRITVRYL